MNATALLILIVIVAAVAVAVWLWTRRKRRTDELREHFGPEYEHALHEHGTRSDAEEELAARKERIEQLHIRPLAPEQSMRLATEWRSVQAQFVDDPENAIGEADRLITEAMQARGYPMADFEQRAADVSVEHPSVVEDYRAGHRLANRAADGQASTEDMRQAMVHFRALFDALIEPAGMEVR